MSLKVRNKEIRKVRVADLEDAPWNFRTHPDSQRAALDGAVSELGWYGYPDVYITDEGKLRICDGHLRKSLLLEKYGKDAEIEVNVTDFNEADARLATATHDPLAAMAEADQQQLGELLHGLEIDSEALQEMLDELAQDNGIDLEEEAGDVEDVEPQLDRAMELREQWGAARGQLWIIEGKQTHRLLCGDSTEAGDVERLMGDVKADLVFTSPPYAQQRDYGENSDCSDWDGLMVGVFANLPTHDKTQVLVNLGLIHRDCEWIPYWETWIEWMRSIGWRRFGWYVWDQVFGLPGNWNGRYGPSHEFVFHFNQDAVEPGKWVDKKPENIKPRNKGESTMRKADGTTAAFTNPAASGQPHKVPDSIIRVTRQVGSDGHPAQFPPDFPANFIQSWPGDTYDPFLGSGTTMLAAEQLNRRCYGMEIEPKYVAVILQRLTDAGCECRIAEQ